MGPATDLIFHLGQSSPLHSVWESNKSPGKYLRVNPDGSDIDAKVLWEL